MLLRRVTKHVKDQNWFAVFIDFLIVVFGVYIGVWIGGYQERQATLEKQKLVVEALRKDMIVTVQLSSQFGNDIDQKFERWKSAREADRHLPPIFYRIPGSDAPPQQIWNSLQQNQLTDLFSPDLISDLGLYYSELEGVSHKYIRYIKFVEAEILPGLKEDPSYFYRTEGTRLKSQFEASMDRLWEWREENVRLIGWAKCLAVRLETPTGASANCIPDLGTSAFDSDWNTP